MLKNKKWVKPALTVLTRTNDVAEGVLALCKRVWPDGGGGSGAAYSGCLETWTGPPSCSWCFSAGPS